MTDSLTPRERWLLDQLAARFMKFHEARPGEDLDGYHVAQIIVDWLAEPPSPPQDGGDTQSEPATPTTPDAGMIDTLRGLARLMATESDEPSDIRGLRARAVAWAADTIEELHARLSAPERAPATERPIPQWIDYAEHAELMAKERAAGFRDGVEAAALEALRYRDSCHQGAITGRAIRDIQTADRTANDIVANIRKLAFSPAPPSGGDALPRRSSTEAFDGGRLG